MEKHKELLAIADEIVRLNPKALISGSLALKMQGISLRREPSDIDIVLNYNDKFTPIAGMKKCNSYEEDEYEDDEYDRQSYKLGEVKIDIFEPLDESYNIVRSEVKNQREIVHYSEIIRFKFLHANGDSYNRFKHRKDIIYIVNELI